MREVERALELLRAASDARSQKQAVDMLDAALSKLREQMKKYPEDTPAKPRGR